MLALSQLTRLRVGESCSEDVQSVYTQMHIRIDTCTQTYSHNMYSSSSTGTYKLHLQSMLRYH